MSWLVQTVWRSIGKKQLVAVTGLGLCAFLAVHLAGNLLIYLGPTAFNDYAKHLEEFPLLLPIELALALVFGVHAAVALTVTVENRIARPVGYSVRRWEGGRTPGSATMWITGPLTLLFLIVHLINFRFAARESQTLYDMVVALFGSAPYVLFYVASMLIAALHVSHGFQSAFRSLGLTHPRYQAGVVALGWAFAAVVAVGFSSIPVWMLLFGLKDTAA
jgi:succinate dehydrogenase / fumarate reductase cytochrome b subunit